MPFKFRPNSASRLNFFFTLICCRIYYLYCVQWESFCLVAYKQRQTSEEIDGDWKARKWLIERAAPSRVGDYRRLPGCSARTRERRAIIRLTTNGSQRVSGRGIFRLGRARRTRLLLISSSVAGQFQRAGDVEVDSLLRASDLR